MKNVVVLCTLLFTGIAFASALKSARHSEGAPDGLEDSPRRDNRVEPRDTVADGSKKHDLNDDSTTNIADGPRSGKGGLIEDELDKVMAQIDLRDTRRGNLSLDEAVAARAKALVKQLSAKGLSEQQIRDEIKPYKDGEKGGDLIDLAVMEKALKILDQIQTASGSKLVR